MSTNESPFPFTQFGVLTALIDIEAGELMLITDTDRTACFEDFNDRIRHANDDDIVAWLMSQGYVKHSGDLRPMLLDSTRYVRTTGLQLTSNGRQLLAFCESP